MRRAGRQKPPAAARHARERRAQSRRAGARRLRRSSRRCGAAQKPIQRSPATSRRSSSRASPCAQAELAELGEEQRHLRSLGRQAAADAQRAFERLVDQSRRFGFVGELEAGIDVGLERKLAQQREAERVDRRDRDVGEAVADLRHSSGGMRLLAVAPRELVQDALPHLGRGLARERDREDVARLDAGEQQPDVAIDQHARLARPGRRLERDVARRIDRQRARLGIAQLRADRRCRSRAAAAALIARHLSLCRRPSTISSRQTVRYGHGPHNDFFAGCGGKCPAAMRSSVVSSRSCASAITSSSVRPFAGRSGTTALSPSNERYIASASVHWPPRVARSDSRAHEAVDRQLQRDSSDRASSSTCSR